MGEAGLGSGDRSWGSVGLIAGQKRDGWTDGWTNDRQADPAADGPNDGRTNDGRTNDGRTQRRTDQRRTDPWTDGRTNDGRTQGRTNNGRTKRRTDWQTQRRTDPTTDGPNRWTDRPQTDSFLQTHRQIDRKSGRLDSMLSTFKNANFLNAQNSVRTRNIKAMLLL